MAADFDKFTWIRAVSADSRLAASDRLILVNIALFSVLRGQDTFSTKQTTIAERCGTTDRQVRRAITAGRSNGYLELVQERPRGRGYHGGDQHRLLWPTGIPDNLSAINQEYRTDPTGIPDTQGRNTGHIVQQKTRLPAKRAPLRIVERI
jgi:hypothetical protein